MVIAKITSCVVPRSGSIKTRGHPHCLSPIAQQDKRVGAVCRIALDRLHSENTSIFFVLCLNNLIGNFPQGFESPGAEYSVRHLMNGRKNSAHLTRSKPDGAVGIRPVALFHVAVSVKEKELIILPGSLAGPHYAFQHGSDCVPDIRPYLFTGCT